MDGLTQEQAAALVGLTTRRLRQIEKEGDDAPERTPAGLYPAEDFGRWMRRRLLAELGVAHDGQAYDYNAERARLTKAQADKTELEVAELRGLTIRLPAVELHWQGMVASMRAKLLSLPSKAAGRVGDPAKLQETQDTLQALVYEALAEIAGDGIPDEVRDRLAAQDRASDASGSEAAAEADDQPVGGRKPRAQRGGQRRAR